MAVSFCRVIFGLALSIIMIVLGSTYSGCEFSLWLSISGCVGIGISIVSILTNCYRRSKDSDQEDNCSFFLNVILAAIVLSMAIWGSVVTFTIQNQSEYCDFAVYMSVFVGLIMYWTILVLYVIYHLCRGLPSNGGYQEI